MILLEFIYNQTFIYCASHWGRAKSYGKLRGIANTRDVIDLQVNPIFGGKEYGTVKSGAWKNGDMTQESELLFQCQTATNQLAMWSPASAKLLLVQ